MGAFTALTTVYLLFRPAEPRARLGPDDEAHMRELLAKSGDLDSLGYFALRRDKSVIWSATHKSCITYRVLSGVMLATGDPLGDPEAWPGAIKEFMIEAERHAWVPAVLACSELGGDVWTRETGMSALEFGDEAVVDVAEFSLDGRTMRNVRQMVNRVERAGYHCRGLPGPRSSRRDRHDVPAAGGVVARCRNRARLLDGSGPPRRSG